MFTSGIGMFCLKPIKFSLNITQNTVYKIKFQLQRWGHFYRRQNRLSINRHFTKSSMINNSSMPTLIYIYIYIYIWIERAFNTSYLTVIVTSSIFATILKYLQKNQKSSKTEDENKLDLWYSTANLWIYIGAFS